MSDLEDKSQKTEAPTPKRLNDAREKGQVPRSKEVDTWVMLTTSAVIMLALAPMVGRRFVELLGPFITRPHVIVADFAGLSTALGTTMAGVGQALAVAAVMLIIASVLSGLLQHGLVFSADTLKPKLSKISLIKGFERQFSLKSLVEFLKGILKIALVAAVIVVLIRPELALVERLVGVEAITLLDKIRYMALKIFGAVIAVLALIAVVDLIYQRFEFFKQQRMSKRDLKDESKQLEGDPMVKARLRAIRMERARRRMMTAVPEADVVVTNPTHFAVALRYKQAEMDAPVVVAKGADLVARRIRELAEEHRVPIVQNPPLARALYQSVEIDQAIPAEHFKAVAEVISYVWSLKGRLGARAPR